MQIYSIQANSWTTFDDLPAKYEISDHTGFGDGAFAYFMGGYNLTYTALNQVFRINVAESMIQELLVIEDLEPMITARGDVASVLNTDSQFAIIAGGFTHQDEFCAPVAGTERYDLAQDTWTALDDMLQPRADVVLVELDDEHVFALGGERQIVGICDFTDPPEPGEKTIAVDDVEILHLDDGDWQQLADLEEFRFRFAAASFKEYSKFYTFGGQFAYQEDCKCFVTTNEVVKYSQNVDFVLPPDDVSGDVDTTGDSVSPPDNVSGDAKGSPAGNYGGEDSSTASSSLVFGTVLVTVFAGMLL